MEDKEQLQSLSRKAVYLEHDIARRDHVIRLRNDEIDTLRERLREYENAGYSAPTAPHGQVPGLAPASSDGSDSEDPRRTPG